MHHILLGRFSHPAEKSQRNGPDTRAAGETTARIPAGPRHRWHQANIPTETGGGDEGKTRVSPLLSSCLSSTPLSPFPPPHPLSHASPLHPHRSALCGWRSFFFLFPSAHPLCAREYVTAFGYNAAVHRPFLESLRGGCSQSETSQPPGSSRRSSWWRAGRGNRHPFPHPIAGSRPCKEPRTSSWTTWTAATRRSQRRKLRS